MHTLYKFLLCGLLMLAPVAGAMCQQDLSTDPPKIIYVDYAAVLVTIDGPPVLRPINGTNLARVVNSPFFIVRDNSTSRNYLYGGGFWYSAAGVTSTNWRPVSNVPAEVLKQQQLARNEAGVDQQASGPEYSIPPSVIVDTEPAELISSTGKASYTRISGTKLGYMDNTDKDVIYDESSGSIYVLLSGRWYRSASLDGPWTYVRADRLPEEFSRIPADSPRSRILANVAGTEEAEQALAEAEIPQESVILRNASGPEVLYDGDPVFQRIDGTKVYWAENTPYQVIRIDGKYYCVDEGVWYVANSPSGVWRVATYIPQDVLRIPASSPVYNVKYVYITRYTDDRVYCGYYPGYLGYYVHGPTVVWGTGYRYRGHYRRIACPRPVTFGYGATFIIRTGNWSFGIGFSPDWFNCGYGWGDRFHGWFGPLGYSDYDPDYRYRRTHRIHTRFRECDYNLYNRQENFRRNAERPQPRNRYRPSEGYRPDGSDNGYRRTPEGWRRGSEAIEGRPGTYPGQYRPEVRPGGRDGSRNQRPPEIRPGQPGQRGQERPGIRPGEEGRGRNERLPGIPGQDVPRVRPGGGDDSKKPPAVTPGTGKPGQNERPPGVRPGQRNPGGNERLPDPRSGGGGDRVKPPAAKPPTGKPPAVKPPTVRPGDREAGEERRIPVTRPIEIDQRGGRVDNPTRRVPEVTPPGQFPKPVGQGGSVNRRLPDPSATDAQRGGGWGQGGQPGQRGSSGDQGGSVNRRLPDPSATDTKRGGGWGQGGQPGQRGSSGDQGGRGSAITPAPRVEKAPIATPPTDNTPKKREPVAKQPDKEQEKVREGTWPTPRNQRPVRSERT